jgi:hypothetical protein
VPLVVAGMACLGQPVFDLRREFVGGHPGMGERNNARQAGMKSGDPCFATRRTKAVIDRFALPSFQEGVTP